jgi:hypothetical protein
MVGPLFSWAKAFQAWDTKMTEAVETEVATEVVPLPAMTEDELKTLARDMAMEKVFTSNHVPDHDARMLGMIFMPLALGGLGGRNPEEIGMIYEYLDRAGPRSINGYPCFFSFRMVRADQMQALFAKYRAIREALEAV